MHTKITITNMSAVPAVHELTYTYKNLHDFTKEHKMYVIIYLPTTSSIPGSDSVRPSLLVALHV